MSSLFERCVIQCDHYGISLPQDPRHFGHWVCHHYLQHMRPSPYKRDFRWKPRQFLVHCNSRAEEVVMNGYCLGTSIMIRYILLQSYSVIVEPDWFKVTAAANSGQRVSSEALKAWCQSIATSPPYHWHITMVLTYSYHFISMYFWDIFGPYHWSFGILWSCRKDLSKRAQQELPQQVLDRTWS